MRDPKSIVIFGGRDDERVIWLKCLLIKCGVCNFADGCMEAERCRRMIEEHRVGLFIVSQSVGPNEMEGINDAARRLAVPVLQL